MNNKDNKPSNSIKDKYIYSYILAPVNLSKEKKTNPTNQINKHVNKYNTKNKHYYNPDHSNYLTNYTYITNSDVYVEKK